MVTPEGSIAGCQHVGQNGETSAPRYQRIESVSLVGELLRILALILGAAIGTVVGFLTAGPPGAVVGAALGVGAFVLASSLV